MQFITETDQTRIQNGDIKDSPLDRVYMKYKTLTSYWELDRSIDTLHRLYKEFFGGDDERISKQIAWDLFIHDQVVTHQMAQVRFTPPELHPEQFTTHVPQKRGRKKKICL